MKTRVAVSCAADNAAGHRDGSPLTDAHWRCGKLVLVHGTGDDNCYYQGTEWLINELAAHEKHFRVLAYPNRSHNVSAGLNTVQHLWGYFTRHLDDKLLSAKSREPEPVADTRRIRGWTLRVGRDLLAAQPQLAARAIELLDRQLEEIRRVVPKPALVELQKVPLYFNTEYPMEEPTAEYHPDAGWLRSNGRDPAMAKGVEFTNIRIFEAESSRMPNFALHELAHAYHDRVLPMGFGHRAIQAAYARAKESGSYDRVERRFGNGKPNSFQRAYALTNPMEYFAECSEAFFTRNDFFPFTRDELERHDAAMFELLEKLWNQP